MPRTIPGPAHAMAAAALLDRTIQTDRSRLVAILSAGLRDITLAEDVLQEAAVSALSHWGRNGPPASPAGWLLKVAQRKAIDRLRKMSRHTRITEALALLTSDDLMPDQDFIPDERLRLIFACCHPALEPKSRVALTLRTVCGLTTAEIARAFLDADTTMGQRLSRAKAKIAATGIPFAIPGPDQWAERLNAVLTAVYLIFTTGYVNRLDETRNLCHEAEFLARLINQLRPDDPEMEGALAVILLIGARRFARVSPDGASLPPDEQDRGLWDAQKIAEGRHLLETAVRRRAPGPFQIKAAIADCHMSHPGPDWPQISALYAALWRFEPTPVVGLNGAVAIARAGDLTHGLSLIEDLKEALSDYQPWHAARADLLARSGNVDAAREAYGQAIERATTDADALFLRRRLNEVR
ncbi:RNA polymerase sigma factor [Sulfitobacter pontiacus]|uniref:RNA polymerase sigma factor n=1 Tax=Sulfitobacter pontiacus TaxID=60137 RepID=UPI00315AB2E4